MPWPGSLGPVCLCDKMLCNPGRITHPFWAFCIKCRASMGKMSWCQFHQSVCSVGTLPPLSWPPASLQGQLEGHPGSSPYSLPVQSAEGAFLLHLGASLSSGCHILCSPPCGKYSEAVLRKACTPISTTAEGLLWLPAAAIKPHAPSPLLAVEMTFHCHLSASWALFFNGL